MANVAGYRQAWIDAQNYMKKAEESRDDLKRDLAMETLSGVLKRRNTYSKSLLSR
ncbi:MAG: hypothetical protein Ct9H300mP4_08690 [Gammaproteobacteria bacterium]|nr:MAG: hypothetical protein Ct9H300mP4_08690 [Gammaproteobacteria bacterium]